MASQQRIALVIGNAAYKGSRPLRNSVNDAALVTKRLHDLGYRVFGGASSPHLDTGYKDGTDLSSAQMVSLFGQFMTEVQPGAIVVIYYAGHGLQVGAKSFLVPVDDTLDPKLPDLGLIEIKKRLETLSARIGSNGAAVVFLDACRDEPLTKDQKKLLLDLMDPQGEREFGQASRTGEALTRGGLMSLKMKRDPNVGRTFIGFATAPGDVAQDGKGTNSAFAAALDRHMAVRGIEIEEMFDRVAKDVLADVAQELHEVQDPWCETNLNRPLYLHPRSVLPIVVLGLGGALAGLVVCLSVLTRGVVVDPMPPWAWGLGLLFGLVAAGGTWKWGSGAKVRDITLAFAGPGIGFALALAIMQIVPAFPSKVEDVPLSGAREIAHRVYWVVTLLGGALYLLGTFLVRAERREPWPVTPIGWLNLALTWGLPLIIVIVLLQLEYYMSAATPLLLAFAMFALLGGVVYAASIALACRAQGGIFRHFGPFTGAITVGLLMSAFYAIFAAITWNLGIAQADANWLLVLLGTLWHGLLGAQLGYCFAYYVPDHKPRGSGA